MTISSRISLRNVQRELENDVATARIHPFVKAVIALSTETWLPRTKPKCRTSDEKKGAPLAMGIGLGDRIVVEFGESPMMCIELLGYKAIFTHLKDFRRF